MTDKQWTPGRVVWRELMTKDVDKAKGYYGELFGWTFQDMPMPEGTYTIAKLGETMVGGMMQLPADDVPPNWMSYVSVEDVDAAAKTVKAEGGTMIVEPKDVPGMMRFAVLSDPSGAVIGMLRSNDGDGAPPDNLGPGMFCWETAMTKDVKKAKDFYGKVLGWTTEQGPGDVAVFARAAGSETRQVADIQQAKAPMPAFWLTYVVVEKLEAARERAEKLGGKILEKNIEVPGVGNIALLRDPAGAMLGLFQPAMG
ncbi:MAG: VOC family protein [Polyangiaceae bacterium]|nr:VOC family protein [Polyangiaceae bacterium]